MESEQEQELLSDNEQEPKAEPEPTAPGPQEGRRTQTASTSTIGQARSAAGSPIEAVSTATCTNHRDPNEWRPDRDLNPGRSLDRAA